MKKSTCTLISVLLLAVFAGIFPACNKEAVQMAYDKQETNIANFVQAQLKADKTATVTYKDGVVRVVLHDTLHREGLMADTLRSGGTVSFYYAGYTLSGASVSSSTLFATNHQRTANSAGWKLSDTTAFKIQTLSLQDPDPHPGQQTAGRPAARAGRRPEPGRMLYPLFREVCLRFPQARHDSCKVSPGLPHLGEQHLQRLK